MTTDFSQSGEQQAILEFAQKHGPGRFLDIGAGNGKTFSNTRALTFIGWTGVCVEPSPTFFDELSRLYSGSPVECVNAAVTVEEGGLMPFHYVRGDHLSSLQEGHSARWNSEVEVITVVTVTLREILEYFGVFDLVSIDTEGSSVHLLRNYSHQGLLWESLSCICCEAENARQRGEITKICQGWSLGAVTPNNLIFWR